MCLQVAVDQRLLKEQSNCSKAWCIARQCGLYSGSAVHCQGLSVIDSFFLLEGFGENACLSAGTEWMQVTHGQNYKGLMLSWGKCTWRHIGFGNIARIWILPVGVGFVSSQLSQKGMGSGLNLRENDAVFPEFSVKWTSPCEGVRCGIQRGELLGV